MRKPTAKLRGSRSKGEYLPRSTRRKVHPKKTDEAFEYYSGSLSEENSHSDSSSESGSSSQSSEEDSEDEDWTRHGKARRMPPRRTNRVGTSLGRQYRENPSDVSDYDSGDRYAMRARQSKKKNNMVAGEQDGRELKDRAMLFILVRQRQRVKRRNHKRHSHKNKENKKDSKRGEKKIKRMKRRRRKIRRTLVESDDEVLSRKRRGKSTYENDFDFNPAGETKTKAESGNEQAEEVKTRG
ncbi:peptidyl-prolyl cis-trans isomerase G-like [Diaphorina citri]|uniref:Peptidyl-prolyl cis-trans isomerase G-like n=1 Tax=Diaphorina citri TaxID=121845 RepID=A0A1S4EC96_DIACI|nr:peptidyl-prolyl cis-trans isomerase G-like [Diaphorina citri]